MLKEALKPWLSLVMFGFVVGIAAGSVMTESNHGEAIAAGEQQIERFSDACARSVTTGVQPKSCENVTH